MIGLNSKMMMHSLSTNENESANGNGGSAANPAPENLPSRVDPISANAALRPQFESLKIVLLALLDRIDALENELRERPVSQLDLRDEVSQFEGALIRAALTSTKGRQRRAARALGMKASTLNAKIQRYHVATAGDDE